MARIGLIDLDGKIPNLALMKLSAHHKALGDEVLLNPVAPKTLFDRLDQTYISVLFQRSRDRAARIAAEYDNVVIGGTGWDLTTTLPPEVENTRPDYDLYTVNDLRIKGIMTTAKRHEKAGVLVNAGIGYTTRGCPRKCKFCVVPKKEGRLHKVAEIGDLINPRSNVVILLDNNFTADPDCIEKLREIKERKLVVDITQGIDVRTMTPDIAKALAEVKHLRSIHYAWDLMPHEKLVLRGMETLKAFVKPWKHLCFMLIGFDTSFDEDLHRFVKIREAGVDPYAMVFNRRDLPENADYLEQRLHHFARWINGRFYKKCQFGEYSNWLKAQQKMQRQNISFC